MLPPDPAQPTYLPGVQSPMTVGGVQEAYLVAWRAFVVEQTPEAVMKATMLPRSAAVRLIEKGVPWLSLPPLIGKYVAMVTLAQRMEAEAGGRAIAAAEIGSAALMEKAMQAALELDFRTIPPEAIVPMLERGLRVTERVVALRKDRSKMGDGGDGATPLMQRTAEVIGAAFAGLLKGIAAKRLPGGEKLIEAKAVDP